MSHRWGTASRHERGYGAAWVKIRERIKLRDNGLCQQCLRQGRVSPFAAVDHIIPKAKGGTDDASNLECICNACHDAKTLAEAADAQGRRPRVRYTEAGEVIWPE